MRMTFGRTLEICFAAGLSLAAAACATSTPPPAPPPDPRTQMAALEARIFALVEAQRLAIDPHAKPLTFDTELATVARKHSADMAARNYLAHAGPDGRTVADDIMDEDANFQGLLGENLAAQHFAVGYLLNVESLAHRFVDSWLASPSHKNNLAFAAYDRSGVGAAVSGDTVYVTDLFATDLGLQPAQADPKTRKVTQFADPGSARDAPAPKAAPPPPPPADPADLLPD